MKQCIKIVAKVAAAIAVGTAVSPELGGIIAIVTMFLWMPLILMAVGFPIHILLYKIENC